VGGSELEKAIGTWRKNPALALISGSGRDIEGAIGGEELRLITKAFRGISPGYKHSQYCLFLG
jgi:hypothetical protein